MLIGVVSKMACVVIDGTPFLDGVHDVGNTKPDVTAGLSHVRHGVLERVGKFPMTLGTFPHTAWAA